MLKDKNAPKRPLSSYILFGNHVRSTNEKISALSINEQAAAIAQLWRSASDEEKQKYVEQAALCKEKYAKERAEYEKSSQYQEFLKAQKSGIKPKRAGSTKISGYRLFIMENKDAAQGENDDPELAGKGHISRCGIKWARLSDAEKQAYNERAAKMVVPEAKEVLESQ